MKNEDEKLRPHKAIDRDDPERAWAPQESFLVYIATACDAVDLVR